MAPKRRQAYVNLDEPIFEAFEQFAATAYPDQPLTAALREAALAYMGTDPLDSIKVAVRRSSWLIAKIQIARLLGGAMGQAAATFRAEGEAALAELTGMGRDNT